MENNIEVFSNEEFGEVRTVMMNDEVYFVGKDVASILGYRNGSRDINRHVDEEDKTKAMIFDGNQKKETIIINESGLYSLILSSKLQNAKKFKHWITSDVLPTIRKTGGYVSNDDLFIDTYLPFADDQTKLLFSTTLQTIRQQNQIISDQKEVIAKQNETIEEKKEIIKGFTDDIDIYTKRDIINRVCKRASGYYANRYKELYRCFKETYHIDLIARCEGYNMKQTKKKDELSTIKYAENFGHIDDLYSCCSKLYETEVKMILSELNELQD